MEWVYQQRASLVRFMRTTQKAAPLVATGVAGLLALSLHVALARAAGLQARAVARRPSGR